MELTARRGRRLAGSLHDPRYIGGGLVLLLLKVDQLPAVFTLIFRSVFSPH